MVLAYITPKPGSANGRELAKRHPSSNGRHP